MSEVQAIDRAVGATERLFVVDSMAGQDAVRAAQSFNAALDLTGVILTKADGDARGGAALSVRQVTGKPILFVGVGEKMRRARAVPSGAHGLAHPRHGRRGLADRAGAATPRTRKRPRSLRTSSPRAKVSTSRTCASSSPSSTAWAACRRSLRSCPNQALPPGALAQVDERMIRRQLGIIDAMTPANAAGRRSLPPPASAGLPPGPACRCRK